MLISVCSERIEPNTWDGAILHKCKGISGKKVLRKEVLRNAGRPTTCAPEKNEKSTSVCQRKNFLAKCNIQNYMKVNF